MNVLCTLLNDPGEMVRPIAEDALRAIKSEIIPHNHNRVLTFVARGKLPIFQDFFQYTNEPNITWTYLWRIRWVRNCEKMMFSNFDLNSAPFCDIELLMSNREVDDEFRHSKLMYFFSKSAKVLSTKYS
jgi:hypothetical protein